MQLFRSEDDVDEWAQRTGNSKGAVFSPGQLWDLARGWYDDRLELDWVRKSVDERQAIISSAGLTGDFWNLTGDQ